MSKALKTVEPQEVSEPISVLGMIDKLIARPDFPVENLERLLAMQERVEATRAKQAYLDAFAKMQPELPRIKKRGAIKIKEKVQSKYAKWEDICDGVLPILTKHGFVLRFRTSTSETAPLIVTAVLSHKEGHSEETSIPVPLDTSGSKNAPQAIGSSTAYGKRYAASAILNIVAEDEDDDGNGVDALAPITDEQVSELIELADKVGADKEKFCKFAGIESFADILKKDFAKAKGMLEAKGRKQ